MDRLFSLSVLLLLLGETVEASCAQSGADTITLKQYA